jgi:inosine/xanthosine triphosphatase
MNNVRLIVVGSRNPVKVQAVEDAAKEYWSDIRIRGVNVKAGISSMPLSKQETRRGAQIRAESAKKISGAWLGVGNEGGICSIEGYWYLFGTTCVTDGNVLSWGSETLVSLPKMITELIFDRNLELGNVIDLVTGQQNTKQHKGAVALLTDGVIERKHVFKLGASTALVRWLKSFNELRQ